MKRHPAMTRRGTILVIVSGICALLAALALAFLHRMREDAAESTIVVQQAQSRVMLVAGCQYVLEASRLGYDAAPPRGSLGVDGAHNEGFGWIDVRSGAIGPLLQDGTKAWDDDTRFPAPGGRAARCPMFVPQRPPFAVGLDACYNPIPGPGHADFGKPLLRTPDPLPVLRSASDPMDPTSWDGWKAGDARPRSDSTGLAWFRCYRHASPDEAVFTITCGSGATLGFRDWKEVQDEGQTAQFVDRDQFEAIMTEETRMWYDVEWSAAVCASDYHLLDNRFGFPCEDRDGHHSAANHPGHRPYRAWQDTGDDNAYTSLTARIIDNNYLMPKNSSLYSQAGFYLRSQMSMSNPVGTIRWIQRLHAAPAGDAW